jgi:nucleoid DNA-binding protein
MTRKRELVDKIALESACPKVTVSRVVNLLLSEIAEALCKEGRLELRGFGVFKVVDVEVHVGRNPKTGKKIKVPACKHVRFRATGRLREKLNPKVERWKIG